MGPVIIRVVPSVPFVINMRLVPTKVLFGVPLLELPVSRDVRVDFTELAIDDVGMTTLFTSFTVPSGCVTVNIRTCMNITKHNERI